MQAGGAGGGGAVIPAVVASGRLRGGPQRFPRGRWQAVSEMGVNELPWRRCAAAARILVVDDEASIADAVATVMRYEGYAVEQANTLRDALVEIERFAPDLVLLDWALPNGEGIELCRRLREQTPGTHVVFLTANDADESKAEALRAGAADYITKPFGLNDFVARVQAVLIAAAE